MNKKVKMDLIKKWLRKNHQRRNWHKRFRDSVNELWERATIKSRIWHFRKRKESEIAGILKYEGKSFVLDFLSILDTINRELNYKKTISRMRSS